MVSHAIYIIANLIYSDFKIETIVKFCKENKLERFPNKHLVDLLK